MVAVSGDSLSLMAWPTVSVKVAGRSAAEGTWDLPRDSVIQCRLHLVVHFLGLFWTGVAVFIQLVLVASTGAVGAGHGHVAGVLLAAVVSK